MQHNLNEVENIFQSNAEQAAHLAKKIIEFTDFRKLIEKSFASDSGVPPFTDVLELLDRENVLSEYKEKPNYEEYCQDWLRSLEKLAKKLQAKGLFEQKDPNVQEVIDNNRDIDIITEAPNFFSDINEFNELLTIYSIGDNFGENRKILPSSYPILLTTLRFVIDGNVSARLIRNPRALNALASKYLEESDLIRQLGVRVENRSGEFEYQKELVELPFAIEGLPNPDDRFVPTIDRKQISDHLLDRNLFTNGIPSNILNMIDEISFHNTNDGLSSDYLNLYSPDLRRFAFADLTEMHLNTVVHEIFEGVARTLTLGEMRSYEKALHKDSVNGASFLTGYVRRAMYKKSDRKLGEKLSRKEDFCEAAALFSTNPHKLHTVAPERYWYMHHFFSARIIPEMRVIFNYKNRYIIETMSEGVNISALRNELLSHQQEPEEKFADSTQWKRSGHIEIIKNESKLDKLSTERSFKIPIEVDLLVPRSILSDVHDL